MSRIGPIKWLLIFACFMATCNPALSAVTNCTTTTCLNFGSCISDIECSCAHGFTGNICEIALSSTIDFSSESTTIPSSPTSAATVATSTVSTVSSVSTTLRETTTKRTNTITVTKTPFPTVSYPLPYRVHVSDTEFIVYGHETKSFEDAVEDCQKLAARLVSNSDDVKFSGFIRALVKQTVNKTGDIYWSPHGDYPLVLPHLKGSQCPATDLTTISLRPCDDKALYICARPTTGNCYPESQILCSGRSSCVQRPTNYSCECSQGFLWQTGCVDIDECKILLYEQYTPPCSYVNAFCKNIPGSYRCICRDNMQGNGINICGYVIKMQQRISATSAPYTYGPSQLSTNGTILFTANALENLLYNIYSLSTYSIVQNGIKVKTMQLPPDSQFVSVIYDVYTNVEAISPTTITEFYKEGERRKRTQWLIAQPPSAASPICSPTLLGAGNYSINFSSIMPGNVAPSLQKCPSGRQLATAECKMKKQADGTMTAYYDYMTVTVIPCNKVLFPPITATIQGPQSVVMQGPMIIRNVEFLTTNFSAITATQIQKSADTINDFAKAVTETSAKVTTTTMTHIVNIANNINKAQKLRAGSQGTSALTKQENLKLSQSMKICSTNLALSAGKSVTINSELVSVEVTNAIGGNGTLQKQAGISFVSVSNLRNGDSTTTCSKSLSNNVQAMIPQQALEFAESAKDAKQGAVNDSLLVSFIHFRDGEFFYAANQSYKIDQVLSMQLEYTEIKDLADPVWYQMPTSVKNDPSKLTLFQCAYMDKTTGDWVPNGCKTITESGRPNCTCNHMTNFALLVQTHDLPKNYALDIIGKIGCSISIIGLVLMLIIHLSFPKLRDSLVTRVHNHLGVNLLISYVVFLAAVERPRNRTGCIIVAALIQYFLLNAWGWMSVECYIMYIKFVRVFADTGSRFLRRTSLLVYLSSAIIVSITLIVTVGHYDKITYKAWKTSDDRDLIPSSYISQRMCWLHSLALVFGFLVIIGIELVINFIAFIFIFRKISWGRQKVRSSREDSFAIKSYLLRAFTLSTLLGLSWIFAIPLTVTDDLTTNIIFGWLFCITNSLQGLFIFLLFCVKRKDVRELWWNALKNWLRCRTQHEADTSNTATVSTGVISTVPVRLTSIINSDPTSDENNDTTIKVVEDPDWDNFRSNKIGPTSSFHPKGMK